MPLASKEDIQVLIELQKQDSAIDKLNSRFEAIPAEIRDATVEVGALAPGTYAIEWWDTRTGEVTPGDGIDHPGGTLSIAVPPFSRDIACTLRK